MKKIKKWDTVQVISTKHKNQTGIVVSVLDDDKIVIEGINVVKRAKKGQWYIEKTHPVHVSNVMYFDTDSQQRSKIKIVEQDGKRKRQVAKTGRILDK